MPIGPDYVVKPSKLKGFTPVPSDKYTVLITDVNLVKQLNTFKNPAVEEDRLNFEFSILDNKDFESRDEDGKLDTESTRGRRLWYRVTPKLSVGGKFKSTGLYKLLCAVEKREVSEEDLVDLAPDTLIGTQLSVFVEINGEFNNVTTVMKADKELDNLAPFPVLTVYEREEQKAEEQSTGESKPAAAKPAAKDEKDPEWISGEKEKEEKKTEGSKKDPDDFIASLEEDREQKDAPAKSA